MILYISCQRDSNTNGLVKPLIRFQIPSFKVFLRRKSTKSFIEKFKIERESHSGELVETSKKDFEKKMKKGVDKRNTK